MTIKITITIK